MPLSKVISPRAGFWRKKIIGIFAFEENHFQRTKVIWRDICTGCCESICNNTWESRVIKWFLLTVLLLSAAGVGSTHTHRPSETPLPLSSLWGHAATPQLQSRFAWVNHGLTPLPGFLLMWSYTGKIRRNMGGIEIAQVDEIRGLCACKKTTSIR